MTLEQKELLLKDICSRLPYGVKLKNLTKADSDIEATVKLYSINLELYCTIRFYTYEGKALTVCEESRLFRPGYFLRYKPYLYPLSNMTEEQIYEINEILGGDFEIDKYGITDLIRNKRTSLSYLELNALFEYFNKNHFDYRGLIPMDLAIDATGLNIY